MAAFTSTAAVGGNASQVQAPSSSGHCKPASPLQLSPCQNLEPTFGPHALQVPMLPLPLQHIGLVRALPLLGMDRKAGVGGGWQVKIELEVHGHTDNGVQRHLDVHHRLRLAERIASHIWPPDVGQWGKAVFRESRREVQSDVRGSRDAASHVADPSRERWTQSTA
eukprot:CAMPEP_0182824018 /NCGR_PEP_ID=MMETSP0006_2-20121128/15068_1 /TAXON_ID=97485 /ORGANISM="Prymnesium parvum, Strain Texoma1" /LENGTH=165 /DNA_ID=CAMNT_0024950991 /DNA_START=408 /DNA_END=906 /DNA_ORIENTATION=-